MVRMATNRSINKFKCRACKAKGTAELSETDHPYNTETHINDVTAGFLVSNALYPDTADVYCVACDEMAKRIS